MSRALTVLSLLAALLATGGLALLALQPSGEPDAVEDVAATDVGEIKTRPPKPAELRLYQTTATLTEDLRDALADPSIDLSREWRRVSRILGPKAAWTLHRIVPEEANPRVRALLVLAAGVHIPDSETVLSALEDGAPVVRGAAALAVGYREGGSRFLSLDNRLAVPVGRTLPPKTRGALEQRQRAEKDPDVKRTILNVLTASVSASR